MKIYDALFLSPHLDDAILSCGGLIGELTNMGKSVLIATFATMDYEEDYLSDLAITAHKLWGDDTSPMYKRKNEDIRACKILNAEYIHLDLYDCIYRKDKSSTFIYTSQQSIFQRINKLDADFVIKDLTRKFQILPSSKIVFVPCGIGNHIDHVLMHSAAKGYYTKNMFYYEDFPYCMDKALRQNTLAKHGLVQHKTININSKSLENKITAILSYKSQLEPIFGNEDSAKKTIKNFHIQNKGEKYWYFNNSDINLLLC